MSLPSLYIYTCLELENSTLLYVL